MDATTILVIAIIACISVAVAAVFRREISIQVKGLFKIQGKNNPARPGVNLEEAAAKGNIKMDDETGAGVQGKKLRAGEDIVAQNKAPKA